MTSDASKPVFVVGCPRSGTSVMSWAIAQSDAYWTSTETHFFYYILAALQRKERSILDVAYDAGAGTGSFLDIHSIGREEFMRSFGDGLAALVSKVADGRRWVDSSPENLLVANLLARIYPEALFIHMVRHPESVIRSMLLSGFPEPWASDTEVAGRTWAHYAVAGLSLEESFRARVLRVKQEDLASDDVTVFERLGEFLPSFDADAAANFVQRNRINSSYDRASLASTGPDIAAPPAQLDESEIRKVVTAQCAELAAKFDYPDIGFV